MEFLSIKPLPIAIPCGAVVSYLDKVFNNLAKQGAAQEEWLPKRAITMMSVSRGEGKNWASLTFLIPTLIKCSPLTHLWF